MRALRILFGALIGLFAVIFAGFVAVLVLIGGAVGLLLAKLGLGRGHFKVNVQRGGATAPRGQNTRAGSRVHAPDAIDIEATPVSRKSAADDASRRLH